VKSRESNYQQQQEEEKEEEKEEGQDKRQAGQCVGHQLPQQ
jgi:hypothetical protein